VAPGGQQLSRVAPDGATIGVYVQTAEQVPKEINAGTAQVMGTQSAEVGQAPTMPRGMAVSQVSPLSTTRLPQLCEQSPSAAGPSKL